MNDRIRAAADEALHLQKDMGDWALEQQKLAQKQAQSAMDIARASVELTRDLQQKVARQMVDTFLPEKDAKSA